MDGAYRNRIYLLRNPYFPSIYLSPGLATRVEEATYFTYSKFCTQLLDISHCENLGKDAVLFVQGMLDNIRETETVGFVVIVCYFSIPRACNLLKVLSCMHY
jgi:hypothetical protein